MSFRDPDEVQARGRDTSPLVQLSFPKSQDKAALYASPGMLKAWSKVLANCLEDVHAASELMPTVSASIPLDDEDCTAWEGALNIMYPTCPLFKVTWDNAERLLLLADKYDMPGITGKDTVGT